jgi:hypothetical protein
MVDGEDDGGRLGTRGQAIQIVHDREAFANPAPTALDAFKLKLRQGGQQTSHLAIRGDRLGSEEALNAGCDIQGIRIGKQARQLVEDLRLDQKGTHMSDRKLGDDWQILRPESDGASPVVGREKAKA